MMAAVIRDCLWRHRPAVFGAIAVVVILISVQAVVWWAVIPEDAAKTTVYLNPKQPTLSALFLNNYVHDPRDIGHLAVNCTLFTGLAAVLVGLTCCFEQSNIRLPRRFFPVIVAIFFLVLPFAISGASIMAAGDVDMVCGFSGIASALLGLVCFLLLLILYIRLPERSPASPAGQSVRLILATVLIVVLATAFMVFDHDPRTNVTAHLTGFYLGLVVSPLVFVLTASGGRYQQAGAAVLIAILLIVPAVIWVFV